MNPLFSIITVTYNAADSIEATLESISKQTFGNFELLIIDGNSTDNTVELAEKANIDNIKIFSEKDKGIYDAMNKGLQKSLGKYVLFLNAGDSFHDENILKNIADKIYENNFPDIVYGQTLIVDHKRKVLGKRHLNAPLHLDFNSFSYGMVVCHQAFFAKKEITDNYNLKYRFSSDYEWCLKCLMRSQSNIYAGDEPIIDYLYEGVTTNNHKKSLVERFKIMSEYYGIYKTICRHISFIPRFVQKKKLK